MSTVVKLEPRFIIQVGDAFVKAGRGEVCLTKDIRQACEWPGQFQAIAAASDLFNNPVTQKQSKVAVLKVGGFNVYRNRP